MNYYQKIYHIITSFVIISFILPSHHTASTDNGSIQFLILHNNDIHARFDETGLLSDHCGPKDSVEGKCFGGMARIAYIVKKYRNEAKNGGQPVIFLNAGDTFTGTPLFQIYRDKMVNDFLNALEPDAVSLGNHEFDLDVTGLMSYLNGANYPIVTANMNLSRVPEMQTIQSLSNYTVINIKGYEIGVIGYVTGDTKFLSDVKDIDFFDEVEIINKFSNELKERGVDIIFALGHSGIEIDKIIAKNCPLVDLVIGGHSHTFLYSGPNPSVEEIKGPYPIEVKQDSGKIVPVVQAYAFTKYMGYLSVTFDQHGNLTKYSGQPILLDKNIPNDDPEMIALLKKYQPTAELLTYVGHTAVLLDGDCRFRECNFGNLFTDAMVFVNALNYTGSGWTDASIAIMQGGGIRASIAKGNITLYDLNMAYPFEHTKVAKVILTGEDLLGVLEHSVHRYSSITGQGEFLQFSGLHIVYDLSKKPFSRVHSVEVLCSNCTVPQFKPLNKSETYAVLMTSYIYGGGDGFEMFSDKKGIISPSTEFQYVRSYIEQMKIVHPAVEWRIKLIGNADNSNGCRRATSNVITSIGIIIFTILLTLFRIM